VNLSTVPDSPRELTFGQLWYETPIGFSGSRFGVSAAYGEIWPSDERRLTGTRTRSDSFEARFATVPLRTRTRSLWLTASAGFSDVSELEHTGPLYKDHIRTIGLAADYQVQDGTGAWNYFTLALRQGLPAFGASESGDPLLSRTDGSGVFAKFEFTATRIQQLNETWSLRLATAGQLASTALLASQEFNLGGQLFGRGYDTADISGDNGIAGSLELRFDHKLNNEILKGVQLYSFIDGGAARDFRGGPDSVASLASAGGGVRFLFAGDMHADIGAAVPLTYRSPANHDRSTRVFFLLSKAFKLCPDQIQMRCS
jgi:hemolysin activation/secretion protein